MSLSIDIALSEDHQSTDGYFDAYLEEKRKPGGNVLQSFRTYKASLLRHIKCEEDLIFPILAEASDEPASAEVSTLRDEHQIIVPLLMEVEKHIKGGMDSTTVERKLFEELHEHNAREELKVYGALDRLLSESQKQQAAEALKSMRFFPDTASLP